MKIVNNTKSDKILNVHDLEVGKVYISGESIFLIIRNGPIFNIENRLAVCLNSNWLYPLDDKNTILHFSVSTFKEVDAELTIT